MPNLPVYITKETCVDLDYVRVKPENYGSDCLICSMYYFCKAIHELRYRDAPTHFRV